GRGGGGAGAGWRGGSRRLAGASGKRSAPMPTVTPPRLRRRTGARPPLRSRARRAPRACRGRLGPPSPRDHGAGLARPAQGAPERRRSLFHPLRAPRPEPSTPHPAGRRFPAASLRERHVVEGSRVGPSRPEGYRRLARDLADPFFADVLDGRRSRHRGRLLVLLGRWLLRGLLAEELECGPELRPDLHDVLFE